MGERLAISRREISREIGRGIATRPCSRTEPATVRDDGLRGDRCTACGELGHTFHECVVLQQRLARQAEASGGAAPAASCGVGAAGVGTSGSEQQPIVL